MGLNPMNPTEGTTTGIIQPNGNDVLCGRGGSINAHPGNEQFRGLVEKYRRIYLNARFKQEKRLIASSIVDEIKALDPPGRFLAKDPATETWFAVGEEKARDKTSQALRENAPSLRAGGSGKKETSTKDATISKDSNKNNSCEIPQPVIPTSTQSAYYPPPQQYPQWTPPPNTPQAPMLGPYSAAQQPTSSSQPPQNSQPPHPNMPYSSTQTPMSSPHPQQMYSMQPPAPIPSSMQAPMQAAQQPNPPQQHNPQHAYGSRVIPGQTTAPYPQEAPMEPQHASELEMHRQDSHSPVPLRPATSETSPRMESPPAPIEVQSAQIEAVGDPFSFEAPKTPTPRQQFVPCNDAHLPMPYSPIATHPSSMKEHEPLEEPVNPNPIPNQDSRMDDSMQVEEDNKSVASSSLLTQVASHIVGNWDLNVFCGNGLADTVDGVGAIEAPKRRETPSSYQHRKRDSTTPRSARSNGRHTSQGDSFQASTFFNGGASFTNDANSMVASVDMNGDNKSTQGSIGWANGPASVDMNASKSVHGGSTAWANGPASVDMHGDKSVQGSTAWAAAASISSARSGASLGSRVTGTASKDIKIVTQDLAKVPSWEQSFRSMSFSSADSKDIDLSMSSASVAKLDVEDNLWNEVQDVKLTIALQQKENAAAMEVYQKRRRAAERSKTYRSGISGAADRFSFARSSNNSQSYDVGDYVPPADGGQVQFPAGTHPQEIADYNLAMSLQKLDQVGAGTVQQWERILRKEREEEEARKLRNARSGYSLPVFRKK
mmetsp:Transcript_20868/g.29449  ORF Transcript_20868/g.29449 Transcript_20868/m.29449 type:complete len:771 (+) Transcript_20868:242-2554(+)